MTDIKKFIFEKLKKLKDKAIYKEIFTVPGLKGDSKYNKNITRDFNDLAILGDRFLSMCFSELLYEKRESNITERKKDFENNQLFTRKFEELNLISHYKELFSEHKYIIIDGDKATIFEAMFGAFYLTTDFYELKTIIKDNYSFFDSKDMKQIK